MDVWVSWMSGCLDVWISAPWDVTFTSRWRQRSERIEPRTYFADASVDPTEARCAKAMCRDAKDQPWREDGHGIAAPLSAPGTRAGGAARCGAVDWDRARLLPARPGKAI